MRRCLCTVPSVVNLWSFVVWNQKNKHTNHTHKHTLRFLVSSRRFTIFWLEANSKKIEKLKETPKRQKWLFAFFYLFLFQTDWFTFYESIRVLFRYFNRELRRANKQQQRQQSICVLFGKKIQLKTCIARLNIFYFNLLSPERSWKM